jgi:hypothetical protein
MELQAQQHKSRVLRTTKSAFRIARNALAILGVFFAYLLVLGYMQYQDRVGASGVSCSLTRCM